MAAGLALLFLTGAVPIRAQKTEAGLIDAWEQEQKADPKTIKFEKIKDRQYHFATSQFPFDGTLEVRNVAIEDLPRFNDQSMSTGTVEVELVGVNEEFHRTFAVSYAQWNQANTFYWTGSPQKWLTSKQYYEQARKDLPNRAFWLPLTALGWLGIFLLVLALLVLSLFRYTSKIRVINQRSERTLQISERNSQLAERNAQIFEQNLKLQQENVKVFQEILAELRKIAERP